jgi:hypothetical protein
MGCGISKAKPADAEPWRGQAGGVPVEDLSAPRAAAPQAAAAPDMPSPLMMRQLEELSSENADLKAMFKDAEKMLEDMQAKCDEADKLKAVHLAQLEEWQAKCVALEAKL